MRSCIAWLVLVGCSNSSEQKAVVSGDGAPRCVDAFAPLAKQLGGGDTPELATLVGTCEQKRWPADVRNCVAKATVATDVATCIEPVLDDGSKAKAAAAQQLGAPPTPSDAVKAQIAGKSVRAIVMVPPGPTADAALHYVKALGLPHETRDRFADAELAIKYRVTRDGIVIVTGQAGAADERYTFLALDAEPRKARHQLARLDRDVGRELTRLLREKKKIYVTKGHGEIGDYASVPAAAKGRVRERRTASLDRQLKDLDFETATLASDALATGVPGDADIVLVLGPTTELAAAATAALASYLDRGGSLLFAVEPGGTRGLGALENKLGVRVAPEGTLTDEVAFLPQRKTPADHRFVVTSKFTAHAATTTLSRSVNKGLLLMDAVALEQAPADGTAPSRTALVRSMESSFLDTNDNFIADAGEPKASRDVVVAFEGAAPASYRAIVLGDADVFADVATAQPAGAPRVMMLGGPLLSDGLRWLARTDAIAGLAPDADTADDAVAGEQDLELRATAVWRSLAELATSKPDVRKSKRQELERVQERLEEARANQPKPPAKP